MKGKIEEKMKGKIMLDSGNPDVSDFDWEEDKADFIIENLDGRVRIFGKTGSGETVIFTINKKHIKIKDAEEEYSE